MIDYSSWKLTLPNSKEVTNPELTDNSEKYLPTVGTMFRCPVNGSTTPNSSYPRMELREMDGNDKASWSAKKGRHTMFFDGAITFVPKTKKHVVCCQIHDADDDVLMIRLEMPVLFIEVGGNNVRTLDANYTLGKKFTIEMVAEKSEIKISYNNTLTKTFKNESAGMYFKAGCYTQSNCSKEADCSASNYGEVVINTLIIKHDESVSPPPITTAKIANQLDYPNTFFGTKHTSRVSDYGCKLCCVKYLYDVANKTDISIAELDSKLILGGCYFGAKGDLIGDQQVCNLFGWKFLGMETDIDNPPTWSPTIKEVDFSAAPGKLQHFVVRVIKIDGARAILDPYQGVERVINYYEKKTSNLNWQDGGFSYRLYKVQ